LQLIEATDLHAMEANIADIKRKQGIVTQLTGVARRALELQAKDCKELAERWELASIACVCICCYQYTTLTTSAAQRELHQFQAAHCQLLGFIGPLTSFNVCKPCWHGA
jgi:hypothetical protein